MNPTSSDLSASSVPQAKHAEWAEQWSMLQDDELFLFQDWIFPNTIADDFSGKTVLEGGSGGGQHTAFLAPHVSSITAVDLNTSALTKQRTQEFRNVEYVEDDIAAMKLEREYDVVFSIGVIHHTDDPDRSAQNLIAHARSGGKVIFWVYSWEGNFWVRSLVEPLRARFLKNLDRKTILLISRLLTAAMYLPIYTVYLLPISGLPFYEYFQNFRKMSFYRNVLNVFDKLNAPQTQFITEDRARSWFPSDLFSHVTITPYKGVSWRCTGIKR